MFLVDKYRNDANSITCHQDIVEKLLSTFDTHNEMYQKLDNVINKPMDQILDSFKDFDPLDFKYSNFQHLIMYGPSDCGKDYVANKLLERIYGKNEVKLKNVEYTISGYGNTKTKVTIKQSRYHIVIEPNRNGFDRYLIQEIIQDYAKTELLSILKYKKRFKVVVINKIDNLSYYAQASLRRTMEKYVKSCKFIFICDQLSKVNEPIRSRCLLVRVPLPKNIKIMEVLLHIGIKEKIKLDYNKFQDMIKQANGSVKIAIWLLDLHRLNIESNNSSKRVMEEIVNLIINPKNYKSKKIRQVLIEIEKRLYLLFITNVNIQKIVRSLMQLLINITKDIDLKFNIIDITSIFEKRIATGTRHVLHLRAYVIKIIYLLSNFYKGKNYDIKLNQLEV